MERDGTSGQLTIASTVRQNGKLAWRFRNPRINPRGHSDRGRLASIRMIELLEDSF
jgi:hypothetical protein